MTTGECSEDTKKRETLVQDVTAGCSGQNPGRLERERIRLLVIHRTSLSKPGDDNPDPVSDLLLDGPRLALRFRNTLLGTGGAVPYHFLVLIDGEVQQLLPLSVRGAHSKGYNHESIAVAVVGANLEHQKPLDMQLDSLVRLVAILRGINGGLRIVGHTDLPGASADPNKVCPGPYLAAADIDRMASSYLPTGLTGSPAHVDFVLANAGVVV
jgi:hypothetical protein